MQNTEIVGRNGKYKSVQKVRKYTLHVSLQIPGYGDLFGGGGGCGGEAGDRLQGYGGDRQDRGNLKQVPKVPEVAPTISFCPIELIFILQAAVLRYRQTFKIAIFGHETWPLGKFPEVAHTLDFYPRGSKLGLFSMQGHG